MSISLKISTEKRKTSFIINNHRKYVNIGKGIAGGD